MDKLKTHSPIYCIMENWENMLNVIHPWCCTGTSLDNSIEIRCKSIVWFDIYVFRKVWTPLVPDSTSFRSMGMPVWNKWANDHDWTTLGLDKSLELWTKKPPPAVSKICIPKSLAAVRPPAQVQHKKPHIDLIKVSYVALIHNLMTHYITYNVEHLAYMLRDRNRTRAIFIRIWHEQALNNCAICSAYIYIYIYIYTLKQWEWKYQCSILIRFVHIL